jgi:hypothetical protein
MSKDSRNIDVRNVDEGWCVASSRAPSKSIKNNIDIAKKIETYIIKSKRFKHADNILNDLSDLQDIIHELTKQDIKLQWILK